MTDTPEPVLAELLTAWEDFIVALRIRDGLPRLGANILVDIFPATEASAYLYTGEERTRIQEVSFDLQDLVQECVGVRDLG